MTMFYFKMISSRFHSLRMRVVFLFLYPKYSAIIINIARCAGTVTVVVMNGRAGFVLAELLGRLHIHLP